jgi:hypothetical protein
LREDNVRKMWSEAELDAALADLNSDVDEEDDGLAFARASLLTAAGVAEAPPAEPRRSGTWRWIAVAAAVTALTGGLVVATSVTGRDPAPVAPAATTPGLDDLRGVDLPIRPGEFRHTTTSSWSVIYRGDSKQAAYVGTQTEVWIPADPAGTWRRHSWMTNTLPGLTVPAPHYEPVPKHATEESGPGGMFQIVRDQYKGMKFQGSWDTPTAPFLAALPADVEQLRAQLIGEQSSMGIALHPGRPNSPGQSLQMAWRVLRLGVVRGEVRVALWRALARVPGIVTTPGTRSPDGRIGIGFTADGTGGTLVADPATAQLIGYTLPPKPEREVPVSTPSTTVPASTPVLITTSQPRSPDKSATTTAPPPPPDVQGPHSTEEESYTYSITQTNS